MLLGVHLSASLQALFLPLWQTVAACIATATSPNMAALTTSLGIGGDLVAGVRGVVLPAVERGRGLAFRLRDDLLTSPRLSRRHKKWLDAALSTAVRAAAVYAGYVHAELSLLFSGCLLGARTLLGALNSLGLVAPDALGDCGGLCVVRRPWWRPFGRGERRKLELVEGSTEYALALAGLASLGFVAQTAPSLLTATVPGLRQIAGAWAANPVARLVRSLLWLVERPFIWADDYLEALAIAARAKSSGLFQGLLPRAA